MIRENEGDRHWSKSRWFSICVPEGWIIEEEDDSLAIFKVVGVGALQLSAYKTLENESAKENLRDYLEERTTLEFIAFVDEVGEQEIANACYLEEGSFWRVWIATKLNTLVLITYSCDSSSKDLERAELDEIVGSLVLES